MDNFYVYMYLRAKNTRHGDIGTPYYVGKGKGMRAYSKNHRVRPPKERARIVIVALHLSETSAHKEEMRLIAFYGRIDVGTGCLRNLTDGGEGRQGRVVTEDERKRWSEMVKSSYAAGNRAKPGPKPSPKPPKRPKCGWIHSKETLVKMSIAAKLIPHLPERIEKQRVKMRGRKQSPEVIAKRVSAWRESAYARRGSG